MRRLGSVQHKVPCVFSTEVWEEPSRKRDCQPYQVVATETLNPVAVDADIESAVATEKVDGTCCYVSLFRGEARLWARLDRKPNKQAEKRFKKHVHLHGNGKGFSWNVDQDFKSVPEFWIPAHGVKHVNDRPVPDNNGHIPGWVPVVTDSKQYCWHSSVVDYELGVALLLRPASHNNLNNHNNCSAPGVQQEATLRDTLEVTAVPLHELLEQTLELIGTNVNGNPYGLGCKKRPLHFLVPHGSVPASSPPPLDLLSLRAWLQTPQGRVEGIVWHCQDGTLLKLHRHHVGLRWPEGGALLSSRPVQIHMDAALDQNHRSTELFSSLARLNGHTLERLQDLSLDLNMDLDLDLSLD